MEEACKVLIDNNISSAPVYTLDDKSPTNKTYRGFFDYADVIAYILLVLQSTPADESESLKIRDIVKMALQGKQVPVSLASGKTYREGVTTF